VGADVANARTQDGAAGATVGSPVSAVGTSGTGHGVGFSPEPARRSPCVLQLKGHEYQFVPAIAFFDLLFGVIAIDCWLQWAAPRTVTIPRGLAAAGGDADVRRDSRALLSAAACQGCHPYTDDRIAVQRAVSHDIPAKATVLILSTLGRSVLEQVLDQNWEWGSRFMCHVDAAGHSQRRAHRGAQWDGGVCLRCATRRR